MYAAESVWLEANLGHDAFLIPGDVPGKLLGNQQGEGGLVDLNDLRQKWSVLEERWMAFLASLKPESLDELVYRKSSSSFQGQRFGNRRGDILLHVCTHSQYTTAQIVNMFRQLGLTKLPDTMLITLARMELI